MHYKLTFEDGSSAYLAHHGTKGMKWGVWNAETAARYAGKGIEGGGGGGGIINEEEMTDEEKEMYRKALEPNKDEYKEKLQSDIKGFNDHLKDMKYMKEHYPVTSFITNTLIPVPTIKYLNIAIGNVSNDMKDVGERKVQRALKTASAVKDSFAASKKRS